MSSNNEEAESGKAFVRVDPLLVERMAQTSVEDLMQVLEDGTHDEKRQAAIELGDRRESSAFDRLSGLLGSHDVNVGNGAALGLRGLGDQRAVPPILSAIEARSRRGIPASALVFAVIDLDARQAWRQLVAILEEGTYLEARHSTDGIRSVWDELPLADQTVIRSSLTRRHKDPEIEEWRANFIDEILTRGGWTPEERASYEDG